MSQPHFNPLAGALRQRAAAAGSTDSSAPVVPLPVKPATRTWSASTDLYSYIVERGFFFPREMVTRYLLSLRTKPFALFSGISGTGKTKLALLTAEYFAHAPGTQARRRERPLDTEQEFFLPIDRVTLRSGTLTPSREQFDYFEVPPGESATVTIQITNVLGATGDMSVRAHNLVHGGSKHVSLALPVSVRRAFEENGIVAGDFLKFEIVEEFKRFRVSLYRPQVETVDELPENRYTFVSVRPSWCDHTALLGCYDDELDRYMRTPVLELLLRARREELEAKEQGRRPAPYFIVLDEMNIARIEHYFSDFLSALESRRYDADGNIAQESLNLHNADAERLVWIDEQGIEYEIPPRLPVPTNVLITGTVNDDASTHGLSPKVLDRANVLEFSAVDFDTFLGIAPRDDTASCFELAEQATRQFVLGQLELSSMDDSQRMRSALEPMLLMNAFLAPLNRHFGYRVLNDTALFVRTATELVGCDEDGAVVRAAVDIQILQKVLPKFFGAGDDRDGALATLLYLCASGELPPAPPALEPLLAAFDVAASEVAHYRPSLLRASAGEGLAVLDGDAADDSCLAAFPRSAGKLQRMLLRQLQRAAA